MILSVSRAKNREEHHCESVFCPNLQKLNEIFDFYRFLSIFSRFSRFWFFDVFLAAKRRTELRLSQQTDLELADFSFRARWTPTQTKNRKFRENVAKISRKLANVKLFLHVGVRVVKATLLTTNELPGDQLPRRRLDLR